MMNALSLILLPIGILALGTAAPVSFRDQQQRWKPQQNFHMRNQEIRLARQEKMESQENISQFISRIGKTIMCSNDPKHINYGEILREVLQILVQQGGIDRVDEKSMNIAAKVFQAYMDNLVTDIDMTKVRNSNAVYECP